MGDVDEKRFEEAYAANLGAVLAYARRRTDASSAEDVVAETFLVAWRRRRDMPAEPLPWLIGITRHTLANHARGDRRQVTLSHRLATERPEFAGTPTVEEIDHELAAALKRMPDDERELLCLLAWERLTRAEAAQVLGCSRATLRLRLHRARRRLAGELTAAAPAPRTAQRETQLPSAEEGAK